MRASFLNSGICRIQERNEYQAFGKLLFGSFMNQVLYKGTPHRHAACLSTVEGFNNVTLMPSCGNFTYSIIIMEQFYFTYFHPLGCNASLHASNFSTVQQSYEFHIPVMLANHSPQ